MTAEQSIAQRAYGARHRRRLAFPAHWRQTAW